MNSKLINKLINDVSAVYYSPPLIREVVGWSLTFDQLDKFAELIVKECARVASETVIECEGVDFDLVRECYEHFGIEP